MQIFMDVLHGLKDLFTCPKHGTPRAFWCSRSFFFPKTMALCCLSSTKTITYIRCQEKIVIFQTCFFYARHVYRSRWSFSFQAFLDMFFLSVYIGACMIAFISHEWHISSGEIVSSLREKNGRWLDLIIIDRKFRSIDCILLVYKH